MTFEQPDTDIFTLPRGVRLGHVDAIAESWEAYERLPWRETRTFDVLTGEPHPSKSLGRVTVIPPVNVPRDGEFGIRREERYTPPGKYWDGDQLKPLGNTPCAETPARNPL